MQNSLRRMSRTAPQITCSAADRQALQRLAVSRTEAKQTVERARMILGCVEGKRVPVVAREWHTRPNTVSKLAPAFFPRRTGWIKRCAATWGQAGLWRGFPQSHAGRFGTTPACRPGLLGWPGGGGQTQRLGACSVARAAQRGDLATLLVCQHGQGVCRQGGGHRRLVSQSTGASLGRQRG